VNGAQAVMATLRDAGIRVCFANPGTSEIHLVSALKQTPGLHAVLCLFEGVATGAADGFGRMAGIPAMTLLHQGAGLAYGLPNLHNAKRAASPVVNLIGDGATTHRGLGAPLESDVAALAGPMSCWVRTISDPQCAGADAVAALAAAVGPPGGVATLIVPADVAWSQGGKEARLVLASPVPNRVGEPVTIGRDTILLLGGPALQARGLAAADCLAQATHARVLAEPFPARLERGAGVAAIERLSANPDSARRQLADCRNLVLVGAMAPVRAFAEPGVAAELTPAGCAVERIDGDVVSELEEIAVRLAPRLRARVQLAVVPRVVSDTALTADTVAQVVGALLPEGAIVVDEANTSSADLPIGIARHDLLTNSGFAIGFGMPLAVGAALACPDRPVICLQADGSAMYTPSALWTQARERLNITTIVLNNRAYAILRREQQRLLGEVETSALFDLSNPDLSFVALAAAMSVPSCKVTTTAELAARLTQALAEPGPHLLEAMVPARS
jgi:acetolactate synthase I/II/III large subunit